MRKMLFAAIVLPALITDEELTHLCIPSARSSISLFCINRSLEYDGMDAVGDVCIKQPMTIGVETEHSV